MFSSRFSPHLLGRDLAALPPVVFAVFALWLGRGGPRPRLVTSLTAIGLLALLATVPWNDLVDAGRAPRLARDRDPARRPARLAAGDGRRGARRGPAAPVRARAARSSCSPSASCCCSAGAPSPRRRASTPRRRARRSRSSAQPRDWIDRDVSSDVAYVYNGDLAAWTVVWEQRFWNPRIDRVVSIIPHFVPGPIPQRRIALPRDGRLPIDERYAVANDHVQFEGSPIATQRPRPEPVRPDAVAAAAAGTARRSSSPARSRTATSSGARS